MSSNLAESTEKKCRKCNELFSDPRLLPCLHSFCKDCILKTIDSANKLINCPTCSESSPLSVNGVEAIPPNLHLEKEAKISKYEKLIKSKTPPPCDECVRDPVLETVSFCCTCTSFLCKECHSQHCLSRKLVLNHKTLLLQGITNVQALLREHMTFSPAKCSLHVKEEIKLYCPECKVPVCLQCALTRHSGHALEDLTTFVAQRKVDISKDVKEMQEMVSKLHNSTKNVKTICESIRSRERTIGDEVKKVFVELRKSLEERESALLKECSEITTKKIAALTTQIDEWSSLKDAIMNYTKFAANSDNSYSDAEFISVVLTLSTRATGLREKIKNISLEPSEDDAVNFDLAAASSIVNAVSVFGSVFAHKPRDYTSMKDPISSIKTSNAFHVAVHNGDCIVANHGGHAIEVYDTHGTKKTSFCGDGQRRFQYPLGVAVVGDFLYVIEYSGNRCQKMSVNGEFLLEIGSGQIQTAWGCAISKSGVLYIAEEGNNRVQVFSQDGRSVGTLCSTPSVAKPRDVAIDNQGTIHVAAPGSGCIKVFDPSTNNYVREYGNGILVQPSGVAVDKFGYCLVGDWSGKSLHIFDPEGNHIHKISYREEICGVAVDDDNHVYVVDYGNQTIYKY